MVEAYNDETKKILMNGTAGLTDVTVQITYPDDTQSSALAVSETIVDGVYAFNFTSDQTGAHILRYNSADTVINGTVDGVEVYEKSDTDLSTEIADVKTDLATTKSELEADIANVQSAVDAIDKKARVL